MAVKRKTPSEHIKGLAVELMEAECDLRFAKEEVEEANVAIRKIENRIRYWRNRRDCDARKNKGKAR